MHVEHSSNKKSSQSGSTRRWISFGLAMTGFTLFLLLAIKGLMVKEIASTPSYAQWDTEVLTLAKEIPVQAEGRVKPLETYASFFMLNCRGDRRIKLLDEQLGTTITIKPTAWLLDILLRPDLAKTMPSFRLDDSSTLESLGMEPTKRRDRFSYNSLAPYKETIVKLAIEYRAIQDKGLELDSGQKEILALAGNLYRYEGLLTYFNVARMHLKTGDNGQELLAWSEIIKSAPRFQKDLKNRPPNTPLPSHLQALSSLVAQYSKECAEGPAWFPSVPLDQTEGHEWETTGQILLNTFTRANRDEGIASQYLSSLENIFQTSRALYKQDGVPLPSEASKKEESHAAWKQFRDLLHAQMSPLNQQEIAHELSYNKNQWFFRALFLLFLPALLLTIISFLFQAGFIKKSLLLIGGLFSIAGLLFLIIGIWQRCLITHRPPVGNLFETIPFITASAVAILLLVELFNRRLLALSLTPIIGFLGLLLARRYELGDNTDPLNPLRAVLVSNFWLTYHVLTISLGYAAGIVAGLVSHAYLFLRLFKLDDDEGKTRKSLTRMSYSLICFTLLLSLIGTVLGGIWANNSWGRFWGWDPKENGALIIVLWCLFILHARLGGIIREWGLHLCSMATLSVVTFSWWGVNMLGEGLHSYGFTEGSHVINLVYLVEMIFIITGMGMAIYQRSNKQAIQ